MDVQRDRFYALTPLSAAIWSDIASGSTVDGLIDRIAGLRSLRRSAAEAVLEKQLTVWKNSELLGSAQPDRPVPAVRSGTFPLHGDVPWERVKLGSVAASMLVKLWCAERAYRRMLHADGLAATLLALGRECRPIVSARTDLTLVRVLRNYYALRRAFRQGQGSHDCLYRSFALTAILRREGVTADLCIGVIDLPFSSHAWVEVDGFVVNERIAVRKEYSVIGRF